MLITASDGPQVRSGLFLQSVGWNARCSSAPWGCVEFGGEKSAKRLKMVFRRVGLIVVCRDLCRQHQATVVRRGERAPCGVWVLSKHELSTRCPITTLPPVGNTQICLLSGVLCWRVGAGMGRPCSAELPTGAQPTVMAAPTVTGIDHKPGCCGDRVSTEPQNPGVGAWRSSGTGRWCAGLSSTSSVRHDHPTSPYGGVCASQPIWGVPKSHCGAVHCGAVGKEQCRQRLAALERSRHHRGGSSRSSPTTPIQYSICGTGTAGPARGSSLCPVCATLVLGLSRIGFYGDKSTLMLTAASLRRR